MNPQIENANLQAYLDARAAEFDAIPQERRAILETLTTDRKSVV